MSLAGSSTLRPPLPLRQNGPFASAARSPLRHSIRRLPAVAATPSAAMALPSPPRNLLFRQLFEHESSTYTYLLGDVEARECILIDPVLETVSAPLSAARVRRTGSEPRAPTLRPSLPIRARSRRPRAPRRSNRHDNTRFHAYFPDLSRRVSSASRKRDLSPMAANYAMHGAMPGAGRAGPGAGGAAGAEAEVRREHALPRRPHHRHGEDQGAAPGRPVRHQRGVGGAG